MMKIHWTLVGLMAPNTMGMPMNRTPVLEGLMVFFFLGSCAADPLKGKGLWGSQSFGDAKERIHYWKA